MRELDPRFASWRDRQNCQRGLLTWAFILAAICLSLMLSAIAQARYCNSPNCAMCNRIFGPMYSTVRVTPTPVRVAPVVPIVPLTTGAVFYSPLPATTDVVGGLPLVKGLPGAGALFELIPSTETAIDSALAIIQPRPGSTLYDLGCGDGRVLIRAAQLYGARRGVGVEINPETARLARQKVAAAGLSDQIEIITGDATTTDLSRADAIYLYLYPETLSKLSGSLRASGAMVVSRNHDVPGLECEKWQIQGETFYVREYPVVSGLQPPGVPAGDGSPPTLTFPPRFRDNPLRAEPDVTLTLYVAPFRCDPCEQQKLELGKLGRPYRTVTGGQSAYPMLRIECGGRTTTIRGAGSVEQIRRQIRLLTRN